MSIVEKKDRISLSETSPLPGQKNPSKRTDSIGPTEQSATSPKLSASALLSLRIFATPTPSASMNGTVIGPVVTPPESNAIPRKSASVKAARQNIMP